MPLDRIINLNDIIRGKFSVNTNTLDDKVLVKMTECQRIISRTLSMIMKWKSHMLSVVKNGCHLWHFMYYYMKQWVGMHQNLLIFHLSWNLEGKGKLSKRDGDKFGFLYSRLTLPIRLQEILLLVTVKKVIYRKLSSIWLPCWDGLQLTIKRLWVWMKWLKNSILIKFIKPEQDSVLKSKMVQSAIFATDVQWSYTSWI